MMMGIPCVATDVGTTPLIIQDGVNGLLARTEDEWLEALRQADRRSRLRGAIGEQRPGRRGRNLFAQGRRGALSGACSTQ